jgi:hypothetical protein
VNSSNFRFCDGSIKLNRPTGHDRVPPRRMVNKCRSRANSLAGEAAQQACRTSFKVTYTQQATIDIASKNIAMRFPSRRFPLEVLVRRSDINDGHNGRRTKRSRNIPTSSCIERNSVPTPHRHSVSAYRRGARKTDSSRQSKLRPISRCLKWRRLWCHVAGPFWYPWLL